MRKATSRARSSRSPTPPSTASTSAIILSDHPIAARWRAIREQAGRGERRAALIPYLTAGHPPPQTSLAALRLAPAPGADLVRGGGPFRDPPPPRPPVQPPTPAAPHRG